MSKLLKQKSLTQDEVKAKIEMIQNNLKLVTDETGAAKPGLETIVTEFQNELKSFEEMLTGSVQIDKAAEFLKLFAGCKVYNVELVDGEEVVADLNDEQKKWLGEAGASVKLSSDATLTYVKKAGGGTGSQGPKTPTAYIDFLIPFEKDGVTHYAHFAKASAAVGKVAKGEVAHEHSVINLLKANGVDHMLPATDSMVREIERLNAKHKLGIRVTINPEHPKAGELAGQTIDLADSPLISGKVKTESESDESTEETDESAE